MSTTPTPHHKSHHPAQSHHSQYTYQRPSTLATRNIVSSDPVEKPTLHRQPTDHYERAVANAKASGDIPEIREERPGLDRKQSWKRDDLKRDVMAQMLEGKKVGGKHEGYTSTSAES